MTHMAAFAVQKPYLNVVSVLLETLQFLVDTECRVRSHQRDGPHQVVPASWAAISIVLLNQLKSASRKIRAFLNIVIIIPSPLVHIDLLYGINLQWLQTYHNQ